MLSWQELNDVIPLDFPLGVIPLRVYERNYGLYTKLEDCKDVLSWFTVMAPHLQGRFIMIHCYTKSPTAFAPVHTPIRQLPLPFPAAGHYRHHRRRKKNRVIMQQWAQSEVSKELTRFGRFFGQWAMPTGHRRWLTITYSVRSLISCPSPSSSSRNLFQPPHSHSKHLLRPLDLLTSLLTGLALVMVVLVLIALMTYGTADYETLLQVIPAQHGSEW